LFLSSQFPGYLANPPKELDPADKTRYEKQYTYLKQIIELFEKPGYSDTDPEANKTVMTLMSEVRTSSTR
jgi:peroxin-19